MRGRLAAGAATACLTVLVCAATPASAADSDQPIDSLSGSGLTPTASSHAGFVPAHRHDPAAARNHDGDPTFVPCGPNAGANLQAAVTAAASGDTLRLAQGCVYGIATPDPASPDSALYVDKTLTILGNGATIERSPSANSDFRVFRIDDPGNLTLRNATVRGGRATFPTTDGDGGGLEVNGSGAALTLEGTRVTGNVAYTGGGGIGNYGGTLKAFDSSLRENTVSNGGAGLEQGEGSATFERSQITHNTADSSLFGYFAAGGGGIRMIGSGTATLLATPVTANHVLHSLTFGGGIENIYGTVRLDRSSVQYNTADGDSAHGGGVSNLQTLEVRNSPLNNNTAAGASSGGFGGGLSNYGTATFTRSPVNDNTASGPGAAGGGIYVFGGQVTTNGPVRNNTPDNCDPAGAVAGCTN
ncbi:hypothetical protein AB0C76_39725 [Kitasatospora sp. NPDC048722]|uniref:hypothetical protein n=1 Tax=Kitasatospora sp. NPDC048722 TaxID=3155639 RepID=UPI0033C4D73F